MIVYAVVDDGLSTDFTLDVMPWNRRNTVLLNEAETVHAKAAGHNRTQEVGGSSPP